MFKTQLGEGGTEERAPPPKASPGPPTWGGGGWRGGGVGHQTGMRFRGSQTEFWVPEGGLSRGFSLSLPAALSPPTPREESHRAMCQRGFLGGKDESVRGSGVPCTCWRGNQGWFWFGSREITGRRVWQKKKKKEGACSAPIG